MAEPLDERLVFLHDRNARDVMEYLISVYSASKLRIAYELKLKPDEIEEVLAKLVKLGLIRIQTDLQRSATGPGVEIYAPTEDGFSLNYIFKSKGKL